MLNHTGHQTGRWGEEIRRQASVDVGGWVVVSAMAPHRCGAVVGVTLIRRGGHITNIEEGNDRE